MTISPSLYNFETVKQTGSTNSDLLGRPFSLTAQIPAVLLAQHQTAGRGRRGRTWQSSPVDQPAGSLTFSLAIERPADASEPLTALSLVIGICILSELHLIYPSQAAPLKVKWPNDLVRLGEDGTTAKVGGILIETKRAGQVQRIVIGVGLNVFGSTAQSMAAQTSYRTDRLLSSPITAIEMTELAQKLSLAMLGAWSTFQHSGWQVFRDDWNRADALAGQAVTVVESGDVQWSGIHGGLDELGQLRVITPSGERYVLVGDVSLRGQRVIQS